VLDATNRKSGSPEEFLKVLGQEGIRCVVQNIFFYSVLRHVLSNLA